MCGVIEPLALCFDQQTLPQHTHYEGVANLSKKNHTQTIGCGLGLVGVVWLYKVGLARGLCTFCCPREFGEAVPLLLVFETMKYCVAVVLLAILAASNAFVR